ncbi:putative sulfate permease [Proteus hauseri ATCC 700826]|uniref:Sulfate permease n=1 Tax=Proteus hauseri ATCC 700826 TaxID=1354271 RepID=A0AAJ3HTT4_PROHU|nr:SulP family inorganic anion transporter [Proteus hauseri]OAT47298.1 putative sulfate permease [Proteus hauseri ATCC 700826]
MNGKRIIKWMPGLGLLFNYKRAYFGYDLKAGLSVAAVALPVAIAYTELLGINAIVGLYACILPMIIYALFGTSRQLITGPDAATCAVIAAVVIPLSAGDENTRWQLAIIMTAMTGFWCILASHFRLGAFTDFLSRPILQGLLNGVAITIMVGQISKVFGFDTSPEYLIEKLIEVPFRLMDAHWPTLLMSTITLALLLGIRHFRSRWPAPLIAMVVMTYLSWQFDLVDYGIAIVNKDAGQIDMFLPVVSMSSFHPGLLRELMVPSINLAVISFVSFMMTARSFASKNGYEVDADQELKALGIANIAAALSQGFAVSAASSRTAVNDSVGGKTQLVSIIAALVILLVLLFMTDFLAYIPLSSLGVVLIVSSWSLLSIRHIWSYRKRNRQAFTLASFTLLAVLLAGLINGIGFAVLLGLLQFLRIVFRPSDQLLGVDEQGMVHSMNKDNDIEPIEGLMMYRFNSPLTYFNVAYFKKRVLQLVDNAPKRPAWLAVDAAVSFTYDDVSVFAAIDELIRELKIKGVKLVLAGRRTELNRWLERNKMSSNEDDLIIAPDLYFVIRLYQSRLQIKEKQKEELQAQQQQTNIERVATSNITTEDVLLAKDTKPDNQLEPKKAIE